MSSSIPLPPWQPRKTVIDLYNERDFTPWWVRTIASLSAIFLMTSSALISSLIFALLAVFTSIALAVLTTSWLFHLDSIFVPHLLMSILGLISCVYNIGTHTEGQFNSRMIGGLILAVVLVIAYTIASLLAFRKIYMVRAREALHRPTSTSTSKTFAMPENELQRQQLMRLLTSQGGAANGTGTLDSSASAEATYKIHWPTAPTSQHSRQPTNASMRLFPILHRGSRSGSRHSSMIQNLGFPPSRNLRRPSDTSTGVIDRMPELPDIIVEESTVSNHGYSTDPTHHAPLPEHHHHHHHATPSNKEPGPEDPAHTHNHPEAAAEATPPPLRPNIYNPLLPAFFEHHPGDRVPSYHPRAISAYTYVPTPRSYHAAGAGSPTPSAPPPLPLGPNGWPLEKKSAEDGNWDVSSQQQQQPFERLKGHRPPLDNYVVVDADAEARARTMGAVRGVGQTKAEIELAERTRAAAAVGGGEGGVLEEVVGKGDMDIPF
ncbi:MAG: hypothetical protein OHK93_007019 [Ramalina farinacea]|uniref:Uncharacterized protein n=1 Tax=Ramalina farinacea TaxID=258253 RepID=A0AA43QL15_9LECA|nr:hypothetical protein [Ramalina farinacea]